MSKNTLIQDCETLDGAKSRFGNDIPVYDDGYGALWILRNSAGIQGICRAQSWEDAYSICEDEFFPDCDLTHEEIVKEYGFKRESVKIIKDSSGVERAALPSDFPLSLTGGTFVRFDTIETPDPDAWIDNELFCEAYGFRNNAPGTGSRNKEPIYCKDLNGDHLDKLTPALLEELEVQLIIGHDGDGEPGDTQTLLDNLTRANNSTFAARWCAVARLELGPIGLTDRDTIISRITDIETNLRELRHTLEEK